MQDDNEHEAYRSVQKPAQDALTDVGGDEGGVWNGNSSRILRVVRKLERTEARLSACISDGLFS